MAYKVATRRVDLIVALLWAGVLLAAGFGCNGGGGQQRAAEQAAEAPQTPVQAIPAPDPPLTPAPPPEATVAAAQPLVWPFNALESADYRVVVTPTNHRFEWRWPDAARRPLRWRVEERGGACSNNPDGFKWRSWTDEYLPRDADGWNHVNYIDDLSGDCTEIRLCIDYNGPCNRLWTPRFD